jgi:hypothetical protein
MSREQITKKALKERGWTDVGIALFLGPPDDTRPNPHYKNGAAMLLYDLDRVETAENSPDYSAWLEEARKHKRAGKDAAVTRKENLKTLLTTDAVSADELARMFGDE